MDAVAGIVFGIHGNSLLSVLIFEIALLQVAGHKQ